MSHTGFPAQGLYRFRNVGAGSFLNLESRDNAPGDPLIGYYDDGTTANLWQLVYTDGKEPIFTLQTDAVGGRPLYVQTLNHEFAPGTVAVVNLQPYKLKFVAKGNNHFQIQLTGPSENLVLALADGANYTPVKVVLDDAGDQNQLWILLP